MDEVKIDIATCLTTTNILTSPVTDDEKAVLSPGSDDDIKLHLLRLLEKKKQSLQISSSCHEYLAHKYGKINKLIEYLGLTMLSLSFVLSLVFGKQDDTTVNIPWTVTTGISMLLKGSKQVIDYHKIAISHERSHKLTLDLADDIEYVILKNNHTKKSLQQSLELYDERIKSFRKTEESIPIKIKQMFIPIQ